MNETPWNKETRMASTGLKVHMAGCYKSRRGWHVEAGSRRARRGSAAVRWLGVSRVSSEDNSKQQSRVSRTDRQGPQKQGPLLVVNDQVCRSRNEV